MATVDTATILAIAIPITASSTSYASFLKALYCLIFTLRKLKLVKEGKSCRPIQFAWSISLDHSRGLSINSGGLNIYVKVLPRKKSSPK